jgi:hypothetical protein
MEDDSDELTGTPRPEESLLMLPDNCDWPSLSPIQAARSEFTTAPTPPPFTVTTEESDGGSDGDIDADLAMMQGALDVNQLQRLNRQARTSRATVERALNNHFRELLMVRGRSRRERGRASRRAARVEQRRTTAASESAMQPTAVFFTRKDRSKTTIKFNPPV